MSHSQLVYTSADGRETPIKDLNFKHLTNIVRKNSREGIFDLNDMMRVFSHFVAESYDSIPTSDMQNFHLVAEINRRLLNSRKFKAADEEVEKQIAEFEKNAIAQIKEQAEKLRQEAFKPALDKVGEEFNRIDNYGL